MSASRGSARGVEIKAGETVAERRDGRHCIQYIFSRYDHILHLFSKEFFFYASGKYLILHLENIPFNHALVSI